MIFFDVAYIFFSVAELSGPAFWREPFRSISTQKRLTEFTVMNVENLRETETQRGPMKQSEKVIVRYQSALYFLNEYLFS